MSVRRVIKAVRDDWPEMIEALVVIFYAGLFLVLIAWVMIDG